MKDVMLTDSELLTKNVKNSVLDTIHYLFLFYENNNNKRDKREIRTYLQILKISTKEHGEHILRHIYRYKASTAAEIYELYGYNYTTICRILNLLIDAGIAKTVGTVQGRYAKNMGRPVKIYSLIDAEPEASHDAQRRYGEILMSKRGDPLRQTELEEAFNIVKIYLDKRDVKRIPERNLIMQLLREKEMKGIEYNLLVSKLVKNGYKL